VSWGGRTASNGPASSKIEDRKWMEDLRSKYREIEASDASIVDSSDLRSIFDLPSSIFDARNVGPIALH
jgi:hypothetical protein